MNRSETPIETTEKTIESELLPGEIALGVLSDINIEGKPMVSCTSPAFSEARVAVTTVSIQPSDIGRQVALMFIDQDLYQPIITGFIHSPLSAMLDSFSSNEYEDERLDQLGDESSTTLDANVDGKKVVIEGKEEIVLKCGASSITLTKSGKILIRGKYVLSRASGINRIMGGGVQVN